MSNTRGTHPAEAGIPVDLADDGLLWLINAAVFHPRGYALAARRADGQAYEFRLLGDGHDPWMFDPSGGRGREVDDCFLAVESLFARARSRAAEQRPGEVLHATAPPSPDRPEGGQYPLCGSRRPDDLMTIPAAVDCRDCLALMAARVHAIAKTTEQDDVIGRPLCRTEAGREPMGGWRPLPFRQSVGAVVVEVDCWDCLTRIRANAPDAKGGDAT